MQRVRPNEDLKKLVLLYVEDEESIREPFLQLIGRYFKHVYVAKNGEEGIELFKTYQKEIDIIVSDIRMPKKDGLSMSKEIKEINADVPIIFSTAFGDSEYLQRAIEVGADGYIIKPIDRNKLFLKLNYISTSVMAKKKTKEYMNLIDTLINHQKNGILLLDENLNVLLINKSLEQVVERLDVHEYKVLDDLLTYCYDEDGNHIDSNMMLANVNKTLICHGKKTDSYYELDIQKVNNYYIIDLDDITGYKKKENEIQETAMIDELTQIYNRKKLDSIKNELLNSNLCIILFDIDNFKKINDTYGHLKGDEVLQSLAKTVQDSVRHSDVFVRWGGEEFIVLLKDLEDIDIAHKLAEKLRIKINEIEIEEVGHFSCSFGVSCGIMKDNKELEVILNKADEALYRAKGNGKNRVEVN